MSARHFPVKTLVLTGKRVKKLLAMKDVLSAVEDVFRRMTPGG